MDRPRGQILSSGREREDPLGEPRDGAIIVLIKYPAGSTGIAHTHPDANAAGYAIEGEAEVPDGNRVSDPGRFSVTPKGVEHSGGAEFTKDTVSLLSWDGPR